MKIEFRKPTKRDAEDIAAWKYEGIYSFYDNDKTDAKYKWASNIHNEENTFSVYDESNQLLGNCCFDFEDGEIIFGVQMRPDLTGKGMGTEFVKAILILGRDRYNFDEIKLYVANFNKRAIRIYEKLEFQITDQFIWHVNEEEKEFIEMIKKY